MIELSIEVLLHVTQVTVRAHEPLVWSSGLWRFLKYSYPIFKLSPLERVTVLCVNKFNPFYARIFNFKFSWNWPNVLRGRLKYDRCLNMNIFLICRCKLSMLKDLHFMTEQRKPMQLFTPGNFILKCSYNKQRFRDKNLLFSCTSRTKVSDTFLTYNLYKREIN